MRNEIKDSFMLIYSKLLSEIDKHTGKPNNLVYPDHNQVSKVLGVHIGVRGWPRVIGGMQSA